MTTADALQRPQATANGTRPPGPVFTYDTWAESLGIPIYRGYYIEDLRKLELGRWKDRGCDAAFIQLRGQEGVSETRVTEVPARATLPEVQLVFDEVVYVVQGRGATTIWRPDGSDKHSFEWQENSMFMLPRYYKHRFSNTHGSEPVRLLHYNYLPMAMSAIPDPDFFFGSGAAERVSVAAHNLRELYNDASLRVEEEEGRLWGNRKEAWVGRFFPDMRAWDKLETNAKRGAGGHSVFIEFPGSEISCHMSVFAARTYKKAHRHGPGRAIVIPAGEGYSILWEEGKEKVIAPWRPGSLLTPPNKWFHQHFNVGSTPARYLAFHPPMQFYGYAEKVEDRARDQIEYPNEEPWIRQMFEEELAKRGLTSLVPRQAYEDPNFAWSAKHVQTD